MDDEGINVIANTPIVVTANSQVTYGFSNKDTASLYMMLADEARRNRNIVGPMPPELFLDTFLHRTTISKVGMPSSRDAFKNVPLDAKNEKDFYEPLVRRRLIDHIDISI